MAGVAGQAVAGGQGGVEIVLRAREVWQVAWGRGFSFEFTVTRTRLPEVRLGFFFSLEPWGKLRLGVGFRTGSCAEAAVFPCEQKMSDSEDSNFSEEEDSERSSDGEEAEVCGRDAGGDMGPGDRTRAERLLWELREDQDELWSLGTYRLSGGREREIGKPKSSRSTGAGGLG